MLINLDFLIQKYKIKFTGILHIGAHECEEIDLYEQYLSRNDILWIEAMPQKVLLNKLRFNNLLIEQAVVSDVVNHVTFHISNNGQSSSVLELGTHSQHHPSIIYVDNFECDTTKTIDVVNKYKIPFNFINLDIQGHELNALIGMEEYLKNIDYIYTEVNIEEIYKKCCLLSDLDTFLMKHDFVRVELSLTQYNWGDAFYIKRTLLITPSNKLIICLEGGLGNRLFQLAAGYSLAKKYDRQLYCYESKPNEHSNINYFTSIFKNFEHIHNAENSIQITEPTYHNFNYFSHDMIKDIPQTVILKGCYQNESYFSEYKSKLLNLLTFDVDDTTLNKYVDLNERYFIHVRRGDYLNHSFFNINLQQYYQRCLNQLNGEKFIIFSDDLEWCKNNEMFKSLNIIYCDENEIDSLYIMSLCKKGGICANSTFSWWGAYLNVNPDKKIYIPNGWFLSFTNILQMQNAIVI